jgi:hypothetical protein
MGRGQNARETKSERSQVYINKGEILPKKERTLRLGQVNKLLRGDNVNRVSIGKWTSDVHLHRQLQRVFLCISVNDLQLHIQRLGLDFAER